MTDKTPRDDFNLEATLDKLRAYRQRDPDFKQAIAEVAEAEAKYGKDDPAEGKVVITSHKSPKRST